MRWYERYKLWLAGFALFLVTGFSLVFTTTYGFIRFYVVLPQEMYLLAESEGWKELNVQTLSLLDQRSFASAENKLKARLHRESDKAPLIHFLLGELYQARGDRTQAIAEYQQAINTAEEGWFNPVAYQYYLDDARAELAVLFYLEGKPEAAKAQLYQLPNFDDQRNPKLLQTLDNVLHNPTGAAYRIELARELHNHLWLDHARNELQQAQILSKDPKVKFEASEYLRTRMPRHIRSIPAMVRYYCLAGDAAEAAGEYRKAANFYHRAIIAMPELEWTYHHLGIVYSNLQEYDKAISYAEKATTINPDFLPPYVTMGDVALDQKNYTLAIRHFTKALEMRSQQSDAEGIQAMANLENQIGFAMEQQGDFKNAILHYTSARSIAEENTDDYQYAEQALERLQSAG